MLSVLDVVIMYIACYARLACGRGIEMTRTRDDAELACGLTPGAYYVRSIRMALTLGRPAHSPQVHPPRAESAPIVTALGARDQGHRSRVLGAREQGPKAA